MLAFTFPGQGSQAPGMGAPWTDHPSWELVAEASQIAGRDVAALLLDADADELRSTENAQLATFVLSLVVLDAVERVGVDATLVAGHSLGEYTALVATGALDYADGVRLVDERGRAMGDAAAARPGTMSAVLGLADERVEAACARVVEEVWAANYNAPGQVVIAGTEAGVAAAETVAKELGAKRARRLSVGGAFHTPLMGAARDRLTDALADIELRPPAVPVVANVDALAHDGADEWRALLAAQLCSPVRWRHSLETLDEAGARTYVELGPGGALSGMAKRTLEGRRLVSVAAPVDVDALLTALTPDAADGLDGPPSAADEGEHLYVTERIVVSPAAGIFAKAEGLGVGHELSVGQVVGTVSGTEVRSPFDGSVMGVMAVDGERVAPSQPIAWLRTK